MLLMYPAVNDMSILAKPEVSWPSKSSSNATEYDSGQNLLDQTSSPLSLYDQIHNARTRKFARRAMVRHGGRVGQSLLEWVPMHPKRGVFSCQDECQEVCLLIEQVF